MPARLAVLSLFVVACRPEPPLSHVPITGGTRAERALVQTELEMFEKAVGSGRIRLRKVEIIEEVDPEDDIAGRFTGSSILLDAGLYNLASVVRHELCHAVDHADGLAGEDELMDELASVVFQEGLSWKEHYQTAREQRGEALANFCELGPVALVSLSSPCPDQSPLLQEVAEWMMDRVYLEYPLLSPLELDRSDAVTMDAWVEGLYPRISATAQPGIVVVEDGSEGRRGLDLYTGRVISPAPEAVPEPQWVPRLGRFFQYDRAGVPPGPVAVLGQPDPDYLPGGSLRTLAYDPDAEAWRPVLGSCGLEIQPFIADGRSWGAWREGPVLRWKPLE